MLSLSEKGRLELKHTSQKDANCPKDQKRPNQRARKLGGWGQDVEHVECDEEEKEGQSGWSQGMGNVVREGCGG